jgi:hypothetical protein
VEAGFNEKYVDTAPGIEDIQDGLKSAEDSGYAYVAANKSSTGGAAPGA